MSHIDNKFFDLSSFFFRKNFSDEFDIDKRITILFSEHHSCPLTPTTKDLSDKSFAVLAEENDARVATKAARIASAVGVTTPHVPVLTYRKGQDLGGSVNPEVRALGAKDVPLPFPFNEKAFEKAKEEMGAVLVDPLEKVVFQKVTGALKRITFDDLISGLRAIIPPFNAAIGHEPFTAVTVKGKSNEWVTQIALHEGLKPPDKISLRNNEHDAEAPVYHEAVLLIDDASYSGTQICRFISNICIASKIASVDQPKAVTKFFVLVPFMTVKAWENILKVGRENDVMVHIIASSTMISLSEVLNEEETNCFKKMIFFDSLPSSSISTLTFTDWRRPDALSVPTEFLDGNMYYTAKDGQAKLYKGAPMVPYLLAPYKIN